MKKVYIKDKHTMQNTVQYSCMLLLNLCYYIIGHSFTDLRQFICFAHAQGKRYALKMNMIRIMHYCALHTVLLHMAVGHSHSKQSCYKWMR